MCQVKYIVTTGPITSWEIANSSTPLDPGLLTPASDPQESGQVMTSFCKLRVVSHPTLQSVTSQGKTQETKAAIYRFPSGGQGDSGQDAVLPGSVGRHVAATGPGPAMGIGPRAPRKLLS